MPIITISTKESVFSLEQKQKISKSIHTAVTQMGFPEGDKFQRFLEIKETDLFIDPFHPSLDIPRSEQFILIEITLTIGRSVDFKGEFISKITNELQDSLSINSKDIMILIYEIAVGNLSFANAKQAYV